MNSLTRLCRAVLVLGSGVTFCTLAMVALFAAVVFPMMKSLDPSLPEFARYSGPHWILVGGFVAARMFEIGLAIAAVGLALSLASVVGLALCRGEARFPITRLALTLLTFAIFLVHATWLQPRMDTALAEFRTAALSGENDAAAGARDRFDGMHPTASRLLSATTIAAFSLFAAAAWTASGPRRQERP